MPMAMAMSLPPPTTASLCGFLTQSLVLHLSLSLLGSRQTVVWRLSSGERQIKCQFVLPVVSLFVCLFVYLIIHTHITHSDLMPLASVVSQCPFCVNKHLHVYLICEDFAAQVLKAKRKLKLCT